MSLKVIYSLLVDKDKIFVPLPKEQQITEESLIELEKNIIKSSIKNDFALAESMILTEQSLPCLDSDYIMSKVAAEENIPIEEIQPKMLKKVR